MGKSSGGYGAFHLSVQHPDLFGALASHAGDCAFELAYRPDFPHLMSALGSDGDPAALLDAFESATDKGRLWAAISVLGMAAAYSPDADAPMGIALPFDPYTGELREEVWARWLAHDPVVIARAGGADVLRDFALVYIDAGLRDEYHLQYGARQLVAALQAREIAVHHEEFDGGHRGVSYRYDQSLPLLTRALTRALSG
jgi:enterochelin esterase family protein